MRSIRMLAATTVILAGAWACGGDGGGVEPNLDPDANFTFTPCTVGVTCTFTDGSVDPDGTITARRWNFGDGSAEVVDQVSVPHTFAEAKDYTVTLTVTDNGGKSNTQTTTVTVTGGTPNNVPPTAAFSGGPCTVNVACAFSDLSSDSDGQVVGWSWNFGDGTAPDVNQNPTHTFATAGTYQVSLTVTDDDGAPSTPIIQPVTVSPVASQDCTSTGADEIDCALTFTAAASRVTVTLTGVDCELSGVRVFVPPPQPAAQDIFNNVCTFGQVGDQKLLVDDAGAPLTFVAGSQLHIRMKRGTGTPPPGAPAANVQGTYPNWTLNIDDGGVPEQPRDFTDVVLTVAAQ